MSNPQELFTERELYLMEWAHRKAFNLDVVDLGISHETRDIEEISKRSLDHCFKQEKNEETEAERLNRAAGPRDGWRPISNCPEETPILVLFHSSICVYNTFISEAIVLDYNSKDGKYGDHNPPWFFCRNGGCDPELTPMHWMPLPEPPEANHFVNANKKIGDEY